VADSTDVLWYPSHVYLDYITTFINLNTKRQRGHTFSNNHDDGKISSATPDNHPSVSPTNQQPLPPPFQPKTMRAAVIYTVGGPEQLKLENRPVPTANPGWVLIRIKAIGLNRSELFTRQGHSPVTFPRILGIEATGLVETAPGGEFAAGDVVVTALGGMGREFDGSYAEFCCVRAERCQKIVCSLPWEVLGACGEMLQTAYGGVFDALQMKAGESLLVRGGTTSVGLAAAAIAKSHGISVVSTTRKMEREKLLLENGADVVVVDDGQIAERVREKTGGGVNKVLELIGTTTLLDSLRCAKKHGIVCMVGMVGNSKLIVSSTPRAFIGVGVLSSNEYSLIHQLC